MSFVINYKPQDPITNPAGETARLLQLDLPSDHPDFSKHSRFLTLLCSQSNQISGMNSEAGERVITSNGPSQPGHCWQCNDLSTAGVPDGMSPIVRGFLEDFEAAAASGCQICQLLLTAISPYQSPGRLKAYIRPGAALNILVKCASKNARYDLFTPIGQPISPWPGIGQARVIAFKNFADDELVSILQSWLRDCKTHQLCQGPTLSEMSPSRIINVANDQLRLQEPEQLLGPYIALSHCWGSSDLPRATTATMQSLKHSIDWHALTKTFQEAIMLTRKLGFDYIWIDSLCIIQDDEEDWRAQAARMAGIYENAELVLSATSAKDGHDGLFRERNAAQILASDDAQDSSVAREYGSSHQIIHPHGPTCTDSDCPVYISRDTARHAQWDPFEMIAQSSGQFNPLLTRAWAFQERLLATRIVHFADHELVWECKTAQRCECMHLDRTDGLPILERRSNNIKIQFSQATSTLKPPVEGMELSELWAKIVESYTERVLSFEKDRLPALSGAIQKLQRSSPGVGPCIGGLFLSEIPRCLLWHVENPGTRAGVYRAPTWSWASITPPANQPPRVKHLWHYYSEGTGGYDYYPAHPCIGPVDGLVRAEGSAGEEPALGILLKGPLISTTFNVEITDAPFLDVGASYAFMLDDATPRNYRYSISRGGQSVSFRPDVLLHGNGNLESGSELFLLAVARRFNQEKPDQILVLKALVNDEDFKRIGMQPQKVRFSVYSRIGIITELKDAGRNWFDDAAIKPMALF